MLKIKKEILEEFDDNCVTEMIMSIVDRVRAATLDEVEKAINKVAEKRKCELVWNVEIEDIKIIMKKLRKKA